MKTGIVVEIVDGIAVIMPPNGVFREQPVQPDWRVGQVVPLPAPLAKTGRVKKWIALAASVLLLAVSGMAVNGLYFQTQSIISMDVNPSFEIELNRLGQVVDVVSYNVDGARLLSDLNLKWKSYDSALPLVMENDEMQKYLRQNEFLEISVYSAGNTSDLLDYVNRLSQDVTAQYPQIQTHCNGAGRELMEEAHRHGMTSGKWMALLELQEVDPTINLDEYRHHGVGEIHSRIRACQQGNQGNAGGGPQRGAGRGQDDGSRQDSRSAGDDSASGQSTGAGQGNGNGYGHGHGHGNC